ncbi:MAG: OsmC family protein [Gemmatimonadaceae bacterium]
MKILLTGEESLRIEPATGQLTIEADTRDRSYSPFHMLGSALGMCTFAVLQSWASNKNIGVDDLKVDVSWKFAEDQHRLETMNVKLDWPSLSAELWPRVIRAANLCGVHHTLTQSPQISIEAVGAESTAIEAPVGT